jgi:transcriptional regulator with XRE-family HTH domain
MTFGARLKELRLAAGLTQEALARSTGISTSTVAKIEHRGIDPAWSTVVRLAKGLGVSLDALAIDNGIAAAVAKPAKRKRGK